MAENDEEKSINDFLPTLIQGKPILRFGTLLRQVCEAAGITQPLLEKYSLAEYEQLKNAGFLESDVFDETDGQEKSSRNGMRQSAISRTLTGKQRPSYIQAYIWIAVVKRHYNDPRIDQIFKDKGLELPKFDSNLEAALWTLAGYSSPQEVAAASFAFKDFSHIPRRLPRGTEIIPQTDANLQIVNRITKDLARMKEPELQC